MLLLLRYSSVSRPMFILEAESSSKSLRRMSTRDPPGGVARSVFLSASSIATAVAPAAYLSAPFWARAGSRSRSCCSQAFSASRALISASVLALSSATFCRAVLMASCFVALASSLTSARSFALGLSAMPSPPPPGQHRILRAAAAFHRAASASPLSRGAATSRTAAAVSAAVMAATAEAWLACLAFSGGFLLGDQNGSVHSSNLLRGPVSGNPRVAGHAANALASAGHFASLRNAADLGQTAAAAGRGSWLGWPCPVGGLQVAAWPRALQVQPTEGAWPPMLGRPP